MEASPMTDLTKGDILCLQRSGALHVVSEVTEESVVFRPSLVIKGVRIEKPHVVSEMLSQKLLYRREIDYSS